MVRIIDYIALALIIFHIYLFLALRITYEGKGSLDELYFGFDDKVLMIGVFDV